MSVDGGARRSTKVNYRYAVLRMANGSFSTPPFSLEDYIRQALSSRPAQEIDGFPSIIGVTASDWSLRRWNVNGSTPEQERICLLMNQIRDGSAAGAATAYMFGDLVLYRDGAKPPLLALAENKPELDMGTLQLDDKRQFLDAMSFWMISKNHILSLQGANARRKHLENYLNWFLGHQTRVLPKGASIVLRDRLALEEQRSGQLPIKRITIGDRGDRRANLGLALDFEEDVERTADVDGAEKGFLERVLAVVMSDPIKADEFLKNIPDGQKISLKVTVGFRKISRKAEQIEIKDVADALRNIDDADISYETVEGSVDGDQLRLSYPVRIKINDHLLDREDVLRALIEAYRSFSDNGFLVEV